MELDFRVGGTPRWEHLASLAQSVEAAGVSGLMFPEASQAPWMSMAAAGMATSRLKLTTGVAMAFPRSPMVTAQEAWEVAANTNGRFRLGLGSQVKAHVERRYSADFDPPGSRLRDYVRAVKACFRAFRGEGPLDYTGKYYQLTLLTPEWTPPSHPYGDIKVDVSAVNRWTCEMAAEVADGIHLHPLHTPTYIQTRLLPAIDVGTAKAGRPVDDVELSILVFVVPGDTAEERAPLLKRVRSQIAFYGSTKNYGFQFDDIGFEGTSGVLNERLKAGDKEGAAAMITDEILEHFAIVGKWDEIAGQLLDRYGRIASRAVMYHAAETIGEDPPQLARWGEVACAIAAAD
jgi:probable F420-dependent oxidoreductase